MSRRASAIYLALAPFLFLLSWYISHRMYTDYLKSQVGNFNYQGKEHSIGYACVFTGLYLAAFLVIRSLYGRPKA